MLNNSDLMFYDPTNMLAIYDQWPKIARESYGKNKDVCNFNNIDHIIFCGMGGSGTLGDILSSLLSKSDIHTCVVKGYHLPKTVDKNSLIVVTSVSGNTPETLTVLKSCYNLDCRVVAFSSGGKMMHYCNQNKILHKKFDFFHSPRASLPAFLYGMMSFLGPLVAVKAQDVIESIRYMENLQKQINSSNLTETNPSLNLADWISGIPMIYYPSGLQAAAIRFKNSLQENAKTHAMAEDIMEASHNGIVSWERPSHVQPIIIRGEDDYYKTKERWEIVKEYFKLKDIDYREINSVKGNILSKLINLIYLLDYATLYRALLSKIDPTPTDAITFIKNKSKQGL